MRHAAVDDVREAHAAVDRLDARLQLRPHPAGDRLQRLLDVVGRRLADHAGRIARVAQPAVDIGEEDDLLRADRARHGARRLVGVDVVRAPLAVRADARDHRDVVGRDAPQQIGVDAHDRPDEAHVLALRPGGARDAEQRAVVAAEPDRRLPVAVEPQDDVLVDLADEDHLGHLDGRLVGDAQAADELNGQVEALHVGGDVGPAAVDDDRVHPDVLQEHHVARELLAQRRVLHRRAAVLDDHGATVELADVGQRLEEGLDISHVVYSALIRTYSWPRSEKKTSVSKPSPGRPTTYSTSSRRTACSSAGASCLTAIPAEQTCTPSMAMSSGTFAPPRSAAPTACAMRPQLGSAPCSAVLTKGEFATARAAASTASACPPRTTTRPMRSEPSPSRTMSSAS